MLVTISRVRSIFNMPGELLWTLTSRHRADHLKTIAWIAGKKSRAIFEKTLEPFSGGKLQKGCQSIDTSIRNKARFTPTSPKSTHGGKIVRELQDSARLNRTLRNRVLAVELEHYIHSSGFTPRSLSSLPSLSSRQNKCL